MWEEEELRYRTPVFFPLRGCACRRCRRVFQGQSCLSVLCVCIPAPFAKRERVLLGAPPPLAPSLKLNRFGTATQLFEGLKACLNCFIDPIWQSVLSVRHSLKTLGKII